MITQERRRIGRQDLLILVASAATIALALIFRLKPSGEHAVVFFGFELPDVCAYRQMTGFWCPGCGLTRSFVALAHGDLREAVGFNPIGPIIFLVVLAQIPLNGVSLARPEATSAQAKDWQFWLIKMILVALLLLGLLRLQWGVTHPAAIHTGAEPPADWATTLLLCACSSAILKLIESIPWQRLRPRAPSRNPS